MDRPDPHAVVNSFVVSLVSCILCLHPYLGHANDAVTPQRNISVVEKSPEIPQWKIIWDKARNLAKEGDFQSASIEYERFFKLKENIEEAQWEYCKVLFQVGDLKQSEKLLAGLLEKNPYRKDYLLLSGKIAFKLEDYTAAAKRYGLAFEQDPFGKDADEALEGMATSMDKLGRPNVTLALNQQLLVRHPDRVSLYYLIAKDAFALKNWQLARRNYEKFVQLQSLKRTSKSVLHELLKVYNQLELIHQQPALLQELISRGDHVEDNKNRLVSIYLETKDYEKALTELSTLFEETGKSRYLRTAGDLARQELDRPDKALAYYEKIAGRSGQTADVKKIIADIQQKLATDFLAIVENGGAKLLWEDLLAITENRFAIFLDIAELLQKKEKHDEVIEVLGILHDQFPENSAISFRLTEKLYAENRFHDALAVLNSIGNVKERNKDYFSYKSRIEAILGMERESLASAREALSFTPKDLNLLMMCLEKAGRLGFVKEMEEIFNDFLRKVKVPPHDVVVEYLSLLSTNSLFSQFESVLARAKSWFAEDSGFQDQLNLLHYSVLIKQEKRLAAEQLLRQMISTGRGHERPALLLAERSLEKGEVGPAKAWYVVASRQTGKEERGADLHARMALVRQKIQQMDGDEGYTSNELRSLFSAQKFTPEKLSKYAPETRVKLLTDFCFRTEVIDNPRLKDGCKSFIHAVPGFNSVIYTISTKEFSGNPQIRAAYSEATNSKDDSLFYKNKKPIMANVLDLVEAELHMGMVEKAFDNLEIVADQIHESTRAMVLASQINLQKGELDTGIKTLQELTRLFPQEEYFFLKLIEARIRRGQYSEALTEIYNRFDVDEDPQQLTETLLRNGANEEVLLLARILWGKKEHKDALKIYKTMLSPSAHDIVSNQFKDKKINYLDYSRERSFWNSMLILMQAQPDILEELMRPEFLIENIGNETGKIVASNWRLYSWQKNIHNEFLAKKAVYDKNYYFAEQSYKKLVENENAEGLKDLAEIYSRLGKHRKEAQVYETIQSRGEETPEIISSMERASLQLSPQNGGELTYKKSEGRDQQIDISISSFSTAFSFTPDLNIDAEVRYTNNNYESVNFDESAGSNSVYGSTNFEIFKGYEIDLGAGTEKLNGTSGFSILYRVGLQGQFDEFFNGFVVVDRQPVTDTISAVRQQITKQSVQTGLNCETPVGVALGVSVLHSDYTGQNSANQFNGYSSYSLFGDKILFSFRYDYEYLAGSNDDFNREEINALGENSAVYWLPDSYNAHNLTMSFQQDFLGYRIGDKEGTSYYKVKGGIGYEDNENMIYSGGVEFFLEMNPHFLLKGNFNFSQSSDYEERGLFMSLFYRW